MNSILILYYITVFKNSTMSDPHRLLLNPTDKIDLKKR